jgi:hypothetical protein
MVEPGYGRSGLEAHGKGAGGSGSILRSDEEGNLDEAQAAAEIEVKSSRQRRCRVWGWRG